MLIILPLLGCSTSPSSGMEPEESEIIPSEVEYADQSHDAASTCNEPPESLVWGHKTYHLKEVGDRDLEPGMKLGYLECHDGIYTQHDAGENANFNIYTYGSPLENDGLLYFGIWGRALYTPANMKEEASRVKPDHTIRIVDDGVPAEKSEARAINLFPELEEAIKEKKQPLTGLFETAMETRQSDGKVDIRFTLKNISGRDLKLHTGSSQRYDFHVLNEKGEEVYRWSNGKAFTAALVEFELKQSGQLEFTEVWMYQDNGGEPVPPGKYTIVVQIMAKPDSGTVNAEELTAKTMIDL